MLRMALRALAALAALFLLFVATRFWLDPVAAAAGMGLAPHGPLGLATLRADNAGAFGAIGLFALFGAVRGDGRLFVPPLVFLGIAIAGRILTLAVVGMSPPLVPPMVIEAVLIALFAANRWALGKI